MLVPVPRLAPLLLLCCARGAPLPYTASAPDQGADRIGFPDPEITFLTYIYMCHLIACPIFFSTVIKGIVCKKNVAHRRMSSRIEKTRLLLLGGALEYQSRKSIVKY
jgi:hypothetical protein